MARIEIDLTTLQGWNDLLVGDYNITVGAKAEGYTRIVQSQAVNVTKSGAYTITTNVVNGTFSGDTTILPNETAEVIITPSTGYTIVSSNISVTNASFSWNFFQRKITLENPTGNVTINAVCTEVQPEPIVEPENCITFKSENGFYIDTYDNNTHWDGTIEYSTDATTWNIWDGTTIPSTNIQGIGNRIYFRGTGNTYITGSGGSTSQQHNGSWNINNLSGINDVECIGNIECLLDYQTVANGGNPPMATNCFRFMFQNSQAIITPPSMPSPTLTASCYYGTFYNCVYLNKLPELPALTITGNTFTGGAYQNMFNGCSSIMLSETQDSTYVNAYRIPTTGEGSGSGASSMFTNTGGTFTGTPTINTTYYTSNDIVQ